MTGFLVLRVLAVGAAVPLALMGLSGCLVAPESNAEVAPVATVTVSVPAPIVTATATVTVEPSEAPAPSADAPAGLLQAPADEPVPAVARPEEDEPWNQPGRDLDCKDIGHRVVVYPPDYHRLDADGDGIGCESY